MNDVATQLVKTYVCEGRDLDSNPRSNIFHFHDISYRIQYSTWPEVYHAPPDLTIRSQSSWNPRALTGDLP